MTSGLTNSMAPAEGHGSGNKYGRLFWRVGLSDGTQIALYADKVEVDSVGALHAVASSVKPDEETGEHNVYPGLVVAPGQWAWVYAASMIDGTAIVVDHIAEPQS